MLISRRQIVIGAGSAILLPSAAFAKRDFFNRDPRKKSVRLLGVQPAKKEDEDLVPRVLEFIPKADYVEAMLALANIHKNPRVPLGSTNEPWNRRWQHFANPLLMHIWKEMGYGYQTDCVFWCAVTLGWCLKRGGKTIPPDVQSSQSFLTYGTKVTTPQRGDICVFTNYGSKGGGHVTIFQKMVPGPKPLFVVGANQELSDPATNCPGNLGVNVVDERKMALKTGGHYLHAYRRPM